MFAMIARPRNFASLVVLLGLLAMGGCKDSNDNDRMVVSGRVTSSTGQVLEGATVYLVPAEDVDQTVYDGQDVLDGTAEAGDEPLEDLIRQFGNGYLQSQVAFDGTYRINRVPMDGRFFLYVAPPAGDTEHLPGGPLSRRAREAVTFLPSESVDIELSSSPSAAASYIGSTACLSCHPEYVTVGRFAHSLGFRRPGVDGPRQDLQLYPDFDEGLGYFTRTTSFANGTILYASNFDPLGEADQFRISLTDPSPAETVYLRVYLWFDVTQNRYKITLENVINPGEPNQTYLVDLTYGGAVYRQVYCVTVPGRKGRYPLLQFQHEGVAGRYDPTRRVFRDYHLGRFWNDATQTFTQPPVDTTVEGNCMACHATGYQTFQDGGTGEWLADAVDDAAGTIDIDADGTLDEINTGCEVCHGPGSEHVVNPAGGRRIIRPELLSASREMMLCGRCHDRVQGAGSLVNEQPLNAQDEMLPPGASRATYLAEHVTRKGPAAEDYWSDFQHAKSHFQQYSEMLRSVKHRNDRILVTCTDCHDVHGAQPRPRGLVASPRDPQRGLCAECHSTEVLTHMQAQTGATHSGLQTSCTDCHMPNTAKSGAGNTGFLLGVPTGMISDNDIVYYQNDIQSHLFGTIPKKTHPDVRGEQPTFAMPIPYTDSCGTCHDPSNLPNQDQR